MPALPVPTPRIGIDALLLSTSATYRAAGTSQYLFHLLRELRLLHPPEGILAYVSGAPVPPPLALTEGFRPRQARWSTERPLPRILWEQGILPWVLRRDRVALVHGGAHALPLGWIGPSVLTIHDLAFLLFPDTSPRRTRLYLRWMVLLAARRADRIIAVSESTRQDVLRLLGVAPERVVRIYEGVDEQVQPILDPAPLEAFRKQHRLPDHFILYLGTIGLRKNLPRLIDAYALLRRRGCTGWPLVLAGATGPGHEAILSHARRSGLGDVIRFAGFVPAEEKALWYNAACLFVYPSLYEGFGLPVVEALACGTPVVASRSSSLPEIVGDAGVLVDPMDTEAIADALQRVLEDEALRQRLAAAGPPHTRQFSWRATAEATLSVYRDVLGYQ